MTGEVMKTTMAQIRAARLLMAGVLAAALVACGGGGGSAGTSKYGDDTPVPTTAVVSDLRMTLSSTSVTNTTSTPVTVTVTAVGANAQVLPAVPVSYSLAGSGLLTVDSSTTTAQGKSTASVDLGDDRANRTIAITATAGGKTVVKYISVVGSKIESSVASSLVDPLADSTVVFVVKDANGSTQSDVPISVSATGGLPAAQGRTLNDGTFVYSFKAPNLPGSTLVFTASAAGVIKQQSVNVKAPAQTVPDANLSGLAASLQANPNVIAVNSAGSTTNKVQLIAIFEDASGNPIPNVRVKFRLASSSQTYGGEFTNGPITGTDVAISGADGKVQVSYIPGTRSSANNAVQIEACYGVNEAAVSVCNANAILSKDITIADEPVSVTIGTDGLLEDEKSTLRYVQYFVMQVVNSAGQPKSNVEVSAQVTPVNYRKGYYVRSGSKWVIGDSVECPKEDLDDDDRIDSFPASEDLNHSNNLEPRRADVALTPVSGTKTNAEGVVLFKMAYPKDKGSWMDVLITATSVVGGSEGRATRTQSLAVLASDISAEGAPAFVESPYGTETGAVTLGANRTAPDGTLQTSGSTIQPCANYK
jgi:hypothetical protein